VVANYTARPNVRKPQGHAAIPCRLGQYSTTVGGLKWCRFPPWERTTPLDSELGLGLEQPNLSHAFEPERLAGTQFSFGPQASTFGWRRLETN
jgi:hypothetical protein